MYIVLKSRNWKYHVLCAAIWQVAVTFEKDHWLHAVMMCLDHPAFCRLLKTPYLESFWTTELLIATTDEYCQIIKYNQYFFFHLSLTHEQ